MNTFYLLAYRVIIIGVQHLDFNDGLSGKDSITGSDVKEIVVCHFSVQGLPDRDLPLILNVFNGKLAEWVPSCNK